MLISSATYAKSYDSIYNYWVKRIIRKLIRQLISLCFVKGFAYILLQHMNKPFSFSSQFSAFYYAISPYITFALTFHPKLMTFHCLLTPSEK